MAVNRSKLMHFTSAQAKSLKEQFGAAADLVADVTASAAEINILDGVTATAGQLNIAAVPASGVEVVAATNVIAATESGKTFFLNSATEFASTLPAPAAGLNYTFVVTGAPSGASYTVATNAAAQVIFGHCVASDGTAADTELTGGATTITFVDGQAGVGDCAYVISDGTNWYVRGESAVPAGLTITG
jgi:hypothetical protein